MLDHFVFVPKGWVDGIVHGTPLKELNLDDTDGLACFHSDRQALSCVIAIPDINQDLSRSASILMPSVKWHGTACVRSRSISN